MHQKQTIFSLQNNIKFSFPTAYTVTLLSWTVIEYHEKYDDIGELKGLGWSCEFVRFKR